MKTDTYQRLKNSIDELPVVDCHDHASKREKTEDILLFIAQGYFNSDLESASKGKEMDHIRDTSLSLEERWPVFERVYRKARHTGYGKAVRMALIELFGTDELTLAVIQEMQNNIPDFSNPASYDRLFEDARIVGRIAGVSWP